LVISLLTLSVAYKMFQSFMHPKNNENKRT
jgi:hypothetical protein